MVDIVNAIAAMRQPGPINMLSGIEGLRSQRTQNQMAQQQMARQEQLQNALAGGDLNALAQVDPIAASHMQAFQAEQFRRSASVLGPIASRIANSKSPRAMARIMQSAPELEGLPQSMRDQIAGIDFDAMTDDELRAEAQALVDQFAATRSGLAGGQPASVRGFNVMTQGLSPEDREKARRIELGLDPRAGSSALERRAGDKDLNARITAIEESQAAAKAAGGAGGLNLTPGQLAVDKAFADEFVAWQAVGGFADVDKNIDQLENVITALESGENITGSVGFGLTVGDQPRRILARTNPNALNTLEQVEEVVQRNLRLILGAQFTEKEGERLIARAYNPNLEESDNLPRVRRLMKSLKAAAQARQKASEFFAKNGTLAGYTGELPTVDSIIADADLSEDDNALPPGVTEADIQTTMQIHGLSRDEVLQLLRQQ